MTQLNDADYHEVMRAAALVVCTCFGLRNGEGQVNRRYLDTVFENSRGAFSALDDDKKNLVQNIALMLSDLRLHELLGVEVSG